MTMVVSELDRSESPLAQLLSSLDSSKRVSTENLLTLEDISDVLDPQLNIVRLHQDLLLKRHSR
jgi:hypothetical protein